MRESKSADHIPGLLDLTFGQAYGPETWETIDAPILRCILVTALADYKFVIFWFVG